MGKGNVAFLRMCNNHNCYNWDSYSNKSSVFLNDAPWKNWDNWSGVVNDFQPSLIAMRLLYPGNVLYSVPTHIESQMLLDCQKQFTFGFAGTIWAIREWKVCENIPGESFIIVSRTGEIRHEFMRELHRKIQLSTEAYFNNHEFQMRFGEEVMIWALQNQETVKSQGLEIHKNGHLVLLRKNFQ